MENNKNMLIKDLIPRFVTALGFILAGQLVFDSLSETDYHHWMSEIESKVKKAEGYLTDTLTENTAKALSFAEDERLADAFKLNTNIEPLLRRPLYEFTYLNTPEAAYIYDTKTNSTLIETNGASPIPLPVLNNLNEMAQIGRGSHNDIIWSGGDTSLIFGGSILSDTGRVEGYAIFKNKLTTVFQESRSKVSQLVNDHIQFDLYRLGNDGTGVVFEHFATKAPYARQVFANQTTMPVFDERFVTAIYANPQKQNKTFLTAMRRLEGFDNWAVSAYIPEKLMQSNSTEQRKLVWSLVAIAILLTFLIPYNGGPYSEALRKAYRSLIYLTRRKKEPKSLEDDLDRLRLGGAMGQSSTSRASSLNTGGNNAAKIPGTLVDVNRTRVAEDGRTQIKAPYKKLPPNFKPRPKEHKPPSPAAIAYNIRTGMKEKRVKLMYQPIFNTQTNEISMYETYMRIIDEGGDIIPPTQWLPIAKKKNLFALIDETVLTVASDRFFQGEEALDIPLTFNISGSTFRSLKFIKKFADTPGFAEKTIFEISSAEMIQDRRAIEFFRDCRNLGFRFSIDYFGGGAETIKAAKKMRFNFVKVDALKFDLNDPEKQKELILLAKTAEAIGIDLVVERIEDKKMSLFCKKVGVPYIQGYYLAEPDPNLATA